MFYTDDTTTPVANSTTALQYQSYLRQFVTSNRKGYIAPTDGETALVPDWSVYGQDSRFFNITLQGFIDEPMPHNREANCQFLNQLVADPANGA
jgi:hypothetical protein